MSSPQKYEKPVPGDRFVSVWPSGETEEGFVIGVKTASDGQWNAVVSSGFRNNHRIGSGDTWSDRSHWHPVDIDNLLWPTNVEVEPSAPLDVEAIIDAIPAVAESKKARKATFTSSGD